LSHHVLPAYRHISNPYVSRPTPSHLTPSFHNVSRHTQTHRTIHARILSRTTPSCLLVSYPIPPISYHIMSQHSTPHHGITHHASSRLHLGRCFIYYPVISCHTPSYHSTLRLVQSYTTLLYPRVSFDLVLYVTRSHQIIYNQIVCHLTISSLNPHSYMPYIALCYLMWLYSSSTSRAPPRPWEMRALYSPISVPACLIMFYPFLSLSYRLLLHHSIPHLGKPYHISSYLIQ
jgi:hypothetical protein